MEDGPEEESDVITIPDTPPSCVVVESGTNRNDSIAGKGILSNKTTRHCNHSSQNYPYSQVFVGTPDMERSRQVVRRRMIAAGIFKMNIQRGPNTVLQVLDVYARNPNLHKMEVRVKFLTECGYDGGGLTCELVGCFWEEFAMKYMKGNSEKVPVLSPLQNIAFYQVGRLLSHSYMLTGFFPTCFSRVFSKALLCNVAAITR